MIKTWHWLHTVILLGVLAAITLVDGLLLHNLVVAWIITMVLVVAALADIGHAINGRLSGVLIDERNQMSLSRLQLMLWMIIIISAFITLAVFHLRYSGDLLKSLDIRVPEQVWGLAGISVATTGGALAIKGVKKNAGATPESAEAINNQLNEIEEQQNNQRPDKTISRRGVLITYGDPKNASVADLFSGDEVGNGLYVDPGKIQMFFFTVLVAIVYAIAVGSVFPPDPQSNVLPNALPDLSTGIVTLLGISSAGYLGTKYAPSTRTQQVQQ